jgi:hypothetical protein
MAVIRPMRMSTEIGRVNRIERAAAKAKATCAAERESAGAHIRARAPSG